MQITDAGQLLELNENEFVGELPKLTDSQINFKGKNNILICEEGVHLWNSRIDFNGENSVLYLSGNIHDYSVNIALHKNNVCFIGKNNFFNGRTTFVLSEAKNIILGDECFISYNVVFRTSDGHCIYHSSSKDRLNYAKSIYVGDHVWFGQNAMVFKGSKIGSGSTIGAGSVVSNKTVPSNATYAGAPLRCIHEDTFWTSHSVHGWGEAEIEKMSQADSDLFVYTADETTLDLEEIENRFNTYSSPDDVIFDITSHFLIGSKNRFAID
ncbi:MAG: acyltransferase [Methanobrevibacter sp.]|uniref:acyltransferase n=1 Tax=Methanobrevibacter sp. TaxID=66852 RepID=UPI0025F141F1|nr:acyltransferase [Methanobrevibacter sp.]MBQ6099321.1 acyltransferase [Methanobrevibacter sp.]